MTVLVTGAPSSYSVSNSQSKVSNWDKYVCVQIYKLAMVEPAPLFRKRDQTLVFVCEYNVP